MHTQNNRWSTIKYSTYFAAFLHITTGPNWQWSPTRTSYRKQVILLPCTNSAKPLVVCIKNQHHCLFQSTKTQKYLHSGSIRNTSYTNDQNYWSNCKWVMKLERQNLVTISLYCFLDMSGFCESSQFTLN